MLSRLNRRFLINLLLLLAFIGAGCYIFIHYDVASLFFHKEKTIAFIRSYHPYDGLVFIILQILQVVFAPIPGEFTGIIGGYIFGPFLGTFYSTIGLTIGSWLAFVIARIFGLPLVEWAVRPEVIRKYDSLMQHKGAPLSFILFLIPGFPKDCLCYILGLSHMKIWTFVAVSTIGRLLGTVMLSLGGGLMRNNQYWTLLILSLTGGIFVLGGYIFRDKCLEAFKKKE